MSQQLQSSLATGDAAPASTRESWMRLFYPVIVLTLVYCFAFADRQIFNQLVEPIKRDFGASDLEISYLLGPAFIFSYVLVALPAGWCADRFNRSRLILYAGIAWGIGTMSAAVADGYTGLFISRLFVGASEAFLYPAGMSLIPDLYDRKKLPIATSIFLLAPPLGGGFALLGGGLVLEATDALGTIAVPLLGTLEGWQLTLVFVGLVGLVPVLLMLTIPDRRQVDTTALASDASQEEQYGFWQGTLYMARRWRFYIMFFVGMSCSSLVMTTVSAWAPTYLARTFGLNHAEIGTHYGSLVLILGIAGGIAAPMISAGLSRWSAYPTMQTVRLGPFMLVTFATLLIFARSQEMALLCLALLTFSYTFPMSMASTSLQLAAPSRLRGTASAYYFVIVSLVGYGIGPTGVPLVTKYVFHDPARIGEAMAIISAIFGLCAAVLLSIAVSGFRAERARSLDEAL
jgi:MFS family permease